MTTSTGGVASAHRGLGFAFLGLGLVMFFLAGLGVFSESHYKFDAHRILGTVLTVVALVLVILAVIGRKEALAASGALLGLMILQNILAGVGEDAPVIGALHPVNGLLILFVAHQAARGLPLPIGGGQRGTRRTAV